MELHRVTLRRPVGVIAKDCVDLNQREIRLKVNNDEKTRSEGTES